MICHSLGSLSETAATITNTIATATIISYGISDINDEIIERVALYYFLLIDALGFLDILNVLKRRMNIVDVWGNPAE